LTKALEPSGETHAHTASRTSESADEQARVETALHDRERELSQLVDMVPSHLWRLTPDGEPVFFNKRMVDFIGLTVSDTVRPGMTRLAAMIEAVVHSDEAPKFGASLRRSLATGEPFAMRYRLRRADGVFRWMSSRAEPMRGQLGEIIHWYGLCHDIDDEVRAQQALRERERELSHLVDMVPGYLWQLTPEGEPNFYNKRLIEFFGLDVAGADKPGMSRLAATIETAVHPDDAPSMRAALENSFATGERFALKYRLRRADGVYRWMSGRAEPLRDEGGRILQWYGLAHDIDDLVTAQQALQAREREISLVVDMVPAFVARQGPDGEMTFSNRRLIDFLGLNVADPDVTGAGEAVMGRLAAIIRTVVHPDDAAMVRENARRGFLTGERFSNRYRMRRADGVYRWMDGRAEPLLGQDGAIVGWYAVSIDVDDEVRAQEALRAREQELALLVDMVPSHLWRLTPDGETTLVNKRMADFLGVDVADKRQLDEVMRTIFHPDDAEAVADVLGRCLVTGENFSMKYRLRRADGVYRWMSGRAEPMRDASGRIVQWFGLCHDIDDQIRSEDALRRASDKLAHAGRAASLAELSASIAHEVNQPLATIVTNSQACQRWLAAEPPNISRALTAAERIIRDANAAADVIGRIRALFRQAPHPRSPEDVNGLIAEVCRLMADEIAEKNARIETNLEANLPSVALDRVQVQQVFVNLIRNGIEAMDSVVDRARALQIRSCREGSGAIRVEVRDFGTGIADAERVFEPFFTTKQHGMGIGLAICRSIVESHGGRLWMTNNEPRGALVAFTLPLPTNA
jgi:PAS domain S-box-containing protein